MEQPGKIRNVCGKIIFFLAIAVILFLISKNIETTQPSNKFNFKKENISYIEFTDERLNCREKEICLIEYIIHSNGLVFAKQEKKQDENKVNIQIGIIDKFAAKNLLIQVKSFFQNFDKKIDECDNCRLFHLFYGDKETTNAFTAQAENSPIFLSEIGEKISKASERMELIDPFFLHFVFKPINKKAIDYHFYSDGIVLKEEFGEKNGELLSSAIYSLSNEEIKKINITVTNEYFSSNNSSFENCPEKNLEWGYLEVNKEEKYKTVYTCGEGTSAADKLFNELLEKTNENN